MTELSDCDLLLRFQDGDLDAFAELVRRCEHSLLKIAARITGDVDEAEEVRQAVLLRLARSPQAIRNPERITAWLRRAVVHEAIATVRKRTRRRRFQAWLLIRATDTDDKTDPPDEVLERSEEAGRLKAVLATLSPEDRALLSLRFDEDLSFAEIGDVLGVPASTLKSRMKPLLARVRSLLGGPEHE